MFGFPREPFLFRIIRGIFLVAFATAFIFYTINIFYKQRKNFDQSNLTISTYETISDIPDFSLCYTDPMQFPPIASNNITTDFNINTDITCRIRNEKCDATDACLCEDYFGRISNESWTDNCWTFSPFKSFDPTKRNEKKEISYLDSVNGSIILTIANRLPPTGNYFAIKFNYAFTNDSTLQYMTPNLYPFNRGNLILIEFGIKIRKRYDNLFSKAYGFKSKLINATANVVIRELQQQAENSTILIIKPKDNLVYTEEETFQYTIGYIISSLGGFYSAIYGIYVLFFGPGKQSPWGLTQKYMCCWDIRREYERKLAKRYVSEANIPLVDPFPYKDTDENRLGTITKDRIERLETMLEECYLDASYFKTLKGVVKANEAYKKEYGLK
ncbi:unnamed protein product [Rhizophagus irregularis]|uniref:Uncharacterized protein n=4 Tax=Rhizophagus irregularis TaxID=588596 RepID=A0A915YTA7_9GLOM|nr:unnamed protein product [Rhizophagus irregularis]CAB5174635.1 unnamed protein product [Rhizophagus irregularis]CAB5335025.1 unnamed protein product [Rhizophagus irregularis]